MKRISQNLNKKTSGLTILIKAELTYYKLINKMYIFQWNLLENSALRKSISIKNNLIEKFITAKGS